MSDPHDPIAQVEAQQVVRNLASLRLRFNLRRATYRLHMGKP